MVLAMTTDSDPGNALPYRPCVGIALIAPSGGVFVGRRSKDAGPEHVAGPHMWQMPQGGIDPGGHLSVVADLLWSVNRDQALHEPARAFELIPRVLQKLRHGLESLGQQPGESESFFLQLELLHRPVMRLRAQLAGVKVVAAGAGVSYGHTWHADAPVTLGLVPLGYGDGIPRHAGNTAEVAWREGRSAVRGRICMDQFMIDLDGDLPQPGTEVVLFGPGSRGEPTAQDWAEALDTINYEIVTRVGGRLTRRYVDEEQA